MQLHELIHSMTKAEKRHFRIYAQMGSKSENTSKYLALFNLLNAQSEYDEEIVKKKGFRSEVKNFLNEKILESLHVFHLRKSPDSELRMLLSQVVILFEKRLWSEAIKRLKKARQLAEEHERFLVLLEIFEWEQALIFKIRTTNLLEKYRSINEEKQLIRKKYIAESEYGDLTNRVFMVRYEDLWFNTPSGKRQFEQLTNTPLLRKDAPTPSLSAKILYHRLNYLLYRHRNQLDEMKKHLKAIIDTVNNNYILFYIQNFAAFYVLTLFRYKQLSDTKDEKQNIHEIINNLPVKSLDITYTIRLQGLIECIQLTDRNEGELLIKQMEEEWIKYAGIKVQFKLCYFMYRAAIFYSMFEDWNKSQKWLNKIFELNRTNPVKDFLIFARLWQLVITYERVPEELDKYVQSSYKYLNRHNYYRETERQIIQSFKGLYKAIDYDEQEIIWQNLYDFLDAEIKGKTIIKIGLSEFQIWCQSKINRTTMAEVIRQRQSQKIM